MLYHILLKPDVFWKGNYKEILEALRLNGIDFILGNMIILNEDLFCKMYLTDFKWEYDYWTHNKQFYTLAPSLSLVCDIPTDKNIIKKLKGSALPIKNESNTIRGDFGVRDRVINSIHWADSQELAIKEIKSVYKLTNINTESLKVISNSENSDISRLCSYVEDYRFDFCGDPFEVLSKIIGRVEKKIIDTLYLLLTILDEKVKYTTLREEMKLHLFTIANKYEFDMEFVTLVKLYFFIKGDIEKSIKDYKLLDYFFAVCIENSIFISEIEKYMLFCNTLYHDVNL